MYLELELIHYNNLLNYVYTEFFFSEGYLEKVQQKYNSPQNLASRINLNDMTNNLNINPPVYMKLSDLSPPSPVPSKATFQSITMPNGDVPSDASSNINSKVLTLYF